jgi:hypothetical protein
MLILSGIAVTSIAASLILIGGMPVSIGALQIPIGFVLILSGVAVISIAASLILIGGMSVSIGVSPILVGVTLILIGVVPISIGISPLSSVRAEVRASPTPHQHCVRGDQLDIARTELTTASSSALRLESDSNDIARAASQEACA